MRVGKPTLRTNISGLPTDREFGKSLSFPFLSDTATRGGDKEASPSREQILDHAARAGIRRVLHFVAQQRDQSRATSVR